MTWVNIKNCFQMMSSSVKGENSWLSHLYTQLNKCSRTLFPMQQLYYFTQLIVICNNISIYFHLKDIGPQPSSILTNLVSNNVLQQNVSSTVCYNVKDFNLKFPEVVSFHLMRELHLSVFFSSQFVCWLKLPEKIMHWIVS